MKKLAFWIFVSLFMATCSWNDNVRPEGYINYSFEDNTNSWKSGDHRNINIINEGNYVGSGFASSNWHDELNETSLNPFDLLQIKFHNFDPNTLVAGPYWFYNGNDEDNNTISISFIDKTSWSKLYEKYLSRSNCDNNCQSFFKLGDNFYYSHSQEQNSSYFIIDKIENLGNGHVWISGSFQSKLQSNLENSPKILTADFSMPLKIDYH